MQEQPIPLGLCQCGCGQRTNVAAKNDPSTDRVKGCPMRFVSGHNGRRQQYRVEDRGYETRCWIWIGSLNWKGYAAQVRLPSGVQTSAHRAYYLNHYGAIPEGFQVDHLCRQRDCVNPDHLEAVPKSINVHRSRLAKLTLYSAFQIRWLRATTSLSVLQLADTFGCTEGTVYSLLKGQTWRWTLPPKL